MFFSVIPSYLGLRSELKRFPSCSTNYGVDPAPRVKWEATVGTILSLRELESRRRKLNVLTTHQHQLYTHYQSSEQQKKFAPVMSAYYYLLVAYLYTNYQGKSTQLYTVLKGKNKLSFLYFTQYSRITEQSMKKLKIFVKPLHTAFLVLPFLVIVYNRYYTRKKSEMEVYERCKTHNEKTYFVYRFCLIISRAEQTIYIYIYRLFFIKVN